MKHLFFSLLLAFPVLASAQDLHTFSNGEVADAEKINENFQYVLENATGSGGCSAEQDGSSVVITCADGTSGVIAGAGTVVVYPEGVTEDQPPVTFNTGDIVLIDANNIVLGKAETFQSGYWLLSGDNARDVRRALVHNDASSESVVIASCRGCWMYYTDEDCTNGPFVPANSSNIYLQDDTYFVRLPDTEQANLLLKSARRSAYYHYGELKEATPCGSAMETRVVTVPVVFNPPTEWVNAAYPVRLEQLP